MAKLSTPIAIPARAPTVPPARKMRDTIVFVDANPPPSVDAHTATGCCHREVMTSLYRGLVWDDHDFNQVLDMAKSFESNADGTEWTVKLHSGITFQDGTPVNSEALKFNIARLVDPKTGSARMSNYVHITEVATPDPLTAVYKLSKPDPDFYELMGERSMGQLVSPTAAKELGVEGFAWKAVGAGPMKVVSASPDRIELERWDGYWKEPFKIKRLVHHSVPETATRFAMLMTGEADVAQGLSPDDVKRLEGHPDVDVFNVPVLTQSYGENRFTDGTAITDVRVRRALNYAIDAQGIVDGAYAGLGDCVRGPAAIQLPFASDFGCWPYDPVKARQLLEEAGYPNGFEMDFYYMPRWAGFDQMVQLTQAYLADVGVKVNLIKIRTAAERNARMRVPAREYERPTTVNPIRISGYLYFHIFRMYHTVSTQREQGGYGFYGNPEVDKLLDLLARTADPKERAPLFDEVSKVIWEDAPYIWLYSLGWPVGVSKSVEGLWISPAQEPFLDDVVVFEK